MTDSTPIPPAPVPHTPETQAPPSSPRRPPRNRTNVPPEQWNDWRWQLKHRLASFEDYASWIELTPSEARALHGSKGLFRTQVTPYFAELIDPLNPRCPIRRQVVPTASEFIDDATDMTDPLGEDTHSPVPGLVHRYPDRVLFLVTNVCAAYCRYCTRKRWVADEDAEVPHFEQAIEYLRKYREIRDVLLSGGDPLLFPDAKLDRYLTAIRSIPHIEFVRIGTRIPCFVPQRVTPELCAMLRKHHPLWMSVHFNVAKELTPEAVAALGRLADAGIPLGCQTVLLKGVNDTVARMKRLVHELLKARVRPYYLYQCDPVLGTKHLRTTVAKGIEIIEGLRGHTTGYAVPTYVIDAPGGGGKVPISPDYVVSRTEDAITIRNFRGDRYTYHDPARPHARAANSSSRAIVSTTAASSTGGSGSDARV
ncbi:MAG TPA: KamA family radical SAM protein [Planctomycetota bacterium]|nr:KamA family radical SAM protein [Planctomycetota bacterium]